jgi:hypothetical protein
MHIDLTSLSIVGILVWLLGWVSKHFLDRLVLPRLVDWWARLNKTWAIKRAEQLLNLFVIELRRASDSRYLILNLDERFAVVVCFVGGVNILLILLVLLQQIVPESERLNQEKVLSLLVLIVVLVIFLVGTFYTNRRLVSIVTNPAKHRDDLVVRLSSLLSAAGLSEDEIKIWLEKVPPIPPSQASV